MSSVGWIIIIGWKVCFLRNCCNRSYYDDVARAALGKG